MHNAIKTETNTSDGQKLQTTIRLESGTFAKIDKIMLSQGISRAEVIRRLLRRALENHIIDFSRGRK